MFLDKINKTLEFVKDNDIYPDIYKVHGASTMPEIETYVKGKPKKVLMFSSNNYLGIATNERVKKALIKGVKEYGMGSGGSRLVSGNIEIQEELEKKVAEFKGYEAAITFSTGYMANEGAIPALLEPPVLSAGEAIKNKIFGIGKPVVFSDELNHASIVDGCRVSKAERVVYQHKNVQDLAVKLRRVPNYKRKLIVTDGVFSMDGDIAPIPGIMQLAKEYNAAVMIDDAHASGILGKNGHGTTEYFNLKRKPEIMMGTFTKAFGAVGGFIAGSKGLIDYLRVTSRTYIFSAPIPPAIVCGIIEGINLIEEERPFEKLWENLNYVMPKLKGFGFNTLDTETQIIPVIIGKEETAVKVSRKLLEEGIFAPAIRWPAVAKGMSRLRITIMATHTKDQLDAFLEKLKKVKELYNF